MAALRVDCFQSQQYTPSKSDILFFPIAWNVQAGTVGRRGGFEAFSKQNAKVMLRYAAGMLTTVLFQLLRGQTTYKVKNQAAINIFEF